MCFTILYWYFGSRNNLPLHKKINPINESEHMHVQVRS